MIYSGFRVLGLGFSLELVIKMVLSWFYSGFRAVK